MADTRQTVIWALEMRCPLRDSEDSSVSPSSARNAVSHARSYSQAIRDKQDGFGNYGDVHVWSYTFGSRPGKPKDGEDPCYPSAGFVISKEFEKVGGTEALFRMCFACQANVRPHEIASCVGTVSRWPDSPETEAQLKNIISRLGLEHDVAAAFPKTEPIWYGLWAVSPVPADSLRVLRLLLKEILKEDLAETDSSSSAEHEQFREFSAAIGAIEVADTRGLKLHVKLLPRGHTDFGIHTVFPHCPFCSATANVQRWQRRYPSELRSCEVCGTQFSPAETATSERIDWSGDDLRDLLGQEKFEQFARDYLIANGEEPSDADGIVKKTEAKEAERMELWRKREELDRQQERYLETNIFAGLKCLPIPPSHLDEDDDFPNPESDCTRWFGAPEMLIVLNRCAEHNIKVVMMEHYSSDGAMDRFKTNIHGSPIDLLLKWQSEGCAEKFHAICQVPDSLVK